VAIVPVSLAPFEARLADVRSGVNRDRVEPAAGQPMSAMPPIAAEMVSR
jgi:hypothetical protein